MSLALRIPSLLFLLRSTLSVLRRFPVTMAAALLATVAALILIDEPADTDLWTKLLMVSALGLPWFTAATAVCEAREWPLSWRIGLLAAVAAALGLYFWQLDIEAAEMIVYPRFLAWLAIGHLLAAAAPYFKRGSVSDFWEYNKELFAGFIIGGVFTLILWAGLSLALLALKELFNIDFDNRIYARLFAVLAGLFQTTHFLHHFPAHFSFSEREVSYNAVFKNLCKYILLPIVVLYFVILYAYSAKILLSWSLPKGWVGSLVLGFSVAGIFAYLLNYLLPKYDQSPIVVNFHKWFWPVLLPMVVLLFVAIGRRITEYGITEPRYIVALAGVWLLVCGLYFVVSKTDNIRFIPLSLSAFLLFAVVGPFNAFNVSQRNQVGQLKQLLETNGRLAGGKINKSLRPVSETDAARIHSILKFLEERDALYRIQPWFDQPLDSLKAIPRQKGITPRVIASLDIEQEKFEQAATVFVTPNSQISQGNIRGYTTFYQVELHHDSKAPGSGHYTAISADGRGLAWREKKGTKEIDLEVFDLHRQIDNWLRQSENGSYFLADDETTIDFNGRRAEMRLVIYDLTLQDKGDHAEIRDIRGILFLKDKLK